MKIAVPVETAEALDSVRAEHFGHAPLFAVAEFEGSAIVGGGVYDSVSHDEFGCAGIAEYVASAFNGWQAVKIGSQVGWVSGEYSEITTE